MSELPAAISGERFEFDSAAGRTCAYVAGNGAPLLLVHSINAAASAAEVRPLHEHCRATRTVFSIDLPGYGHAERSRRRHSPRRMTDALHAMLAQIRQRCGDAPIDALALSLSCEFLARAAVEAPARLGRLALVSPTGFSGTRVWREPPLSTRRKVWLHALLRGPGGLWGGALFRALTRPAVIRYFLRRTWGAKDIDETLWRYNVLSTRVSGAEHAPLDFLSGGLFSADIHTVYEQLTQPVWMSHGQRGDFTDYRQKTIVQQRPNWRFSEFPTGALPYFEMPQPFFEAFDSFIGAPVLAPSSKLGGEGAMPA